MKRQAEIVPTAAIDLYGPLEAFDPYNALLRDYEHRSRLLGRDVAHHPRTIRRVLDALDASGPTEAGDVIQSLVWRLVLAKLRADRFVKELWECEQRGTHEAKTAQKA
jgi:hypothetical protein